MSRPRPGRSTKASLLLILVAAPLLSGCVAQDLEHGHDEPCNAERLLVAGIEHLAAQRHDDGGFAAYPNSDPDARTTAWVLLAAALARRAGHEGHFDPTDHLIWLKRNADQVAREGHAIDSAANNLSLARAAFQTWGLDPAGVRLHDHSTIADAWDARYDATNGTYGVRLNEHLFGAFAAILFEPRGERHEAMAHWVGDPRLNTHLAREGHDVYTFDAWFAAYARLAQGPTPDNATLAAILDEALESHIDPQTGGVRGFQTATRADASSTAAALTRWSLIDPAEHETDRRAAIGYLCAQQAPHGAIRFSDDRDFASMKTTAEAIIAVALHLEPIPLDDPAA